METQKTTNALNVEQFRQLEKKMEILEKKLQDLEDERDRAFRFGVIALGTAVIAMGVWIFNQVVGGHIK